MHIGFTGTRKGLTNVQKLHLVDLVALGNADIFHHGDCIGADADFHDIIRKINPQARIIIHPPIINSLRAFKKGDEILSMKSYIERNHDIVNTTEYLIACPTTKHNIWRSGTWATIRYAKKLGKKVVIL